MEFVVKRPYGRRIPVDEGLRSYLMPPNVGIVQFFHKLFCMVPWRDYMKSDIISMVVPALVEERGLLECGTLPSFSPCIRERCKTRILLLYISCLDNVWRVLREQCNGVRLSLLLSSGWWQLPMTGPNIVKSVNLMHDTLFMGAVLRCILNNEGYITLMLFAITEHYERVFRGKHQAFTIIGKNNTLSVKQAGRFRPLANIANEAMMTIFGAWNSGPSIKLKIEKGKNILLHSQQCYAFALGLYNLSCEMEGDGVFLWDDTLFSHGQPLSGKAEDFLNQVSLLSDNVENAFKSLDVPLVRYVGSPLSSREVMLSIKKQGFGKEVSVSVPLPTHAKTRINAFAKNKVVTLYIVCPRLHSISCLNEAYTRKTNSQSVQKSRRFVRHSNKVSTGLGPCTFSLYKTHDNKGVGSCINTLNFHTSGNLLELCISSAAVELDIMKGNPKCMYPVTLPVRAHHNTCTTVDLPGILNPETALSHTKMVWDSGSAPAIGPTKTTRFPAYNVFVKYPDAENELQTINLPPVSAVVLPGRKQGFPQCHEVDVDGEDNYKPRSSKKPRAYAVFDGKGIVCMEERYTILQMRQMMRRSVSWEMHKNNINTSYFYGDTLADRLQSVLSWYLGHSGVEFDPRKQNFIASVEKEAHALLPFAVSILAEMEYIMKGSPIAAQISVQDLFVSRSMICTYGSFSRGNAQVAPTSKCMLSHISKQYRLQWVDQAFRMNENVLCTLVKMEEMDMGQIRSQIKEFLKKKKGHVGLCSTRNRAEGLVSSLMYGPEAFVRKFTNAVPVLKALALHVKRDTRDNNYFLSVLEKNYG